MNRKAVAQELVKVAKLLVGESDGIDELLRRHQTSDRTGEAENLITEFVRAVKSGGWEYAAVFKGKSKPGRNPSKSYKLNPAAYSEENVRKVVTTPVFLEQQHDRLIFTFTGTAGRTDTYVMTKVPYHELIGAPAPAKKVHEIADEVKRKLREMGLPSLGQRYGKAGEFFGIHGGTRVIAVGNRDLLLNRLQVSISYPEDLKSPDTRWGMKESILLSKVDDDTLQQAVEWAKAGDTSVNLRQKVREEYQKKNSYSVVWG
jgi:hypothetical protein